MLREIGFYGPGTIPIDFIEKLGNPGEYPYTRGIYPDMYRQKKPTIREFAGHGQAADTNERFELILAEGGTGLSTAFDIPTLMGRDADEEICEGQVGWDGVTINTVADMDKLFLDIPIDKVTVSMTINAPAAAIWAMYLASAQKRKIPFAFLGGTLQNDILKEYAAQKEWLFPEEHGVKLVVDTIEYAARHLPKWHAVSISGYHIREAGATAAEEIAYTLASGIEYVYRTIKRGLDVDLFAPNLSFFFDLHNNFFEEIAKLRAARRIWAKVMRDRFCAKKGRSLWCRMHVQTAGVTLTAQEPHNNIVRVAIQALAAMLGGAQSIHTNSWDEVLCTPTDEAVRTAIRTQQILQDETGICEFIDPLGGAPMIEDLTNHIEEKALAEIEQIERLGGMLAAVKMGYPQNQIRQSANRQEQDMESGQIVQIGVNKYRSEDITEPENVRKELEAREESENLQIEELSHTKESRDKNAVSRALDALKKSAVKNQNLMPDLINAASAQASLGEISKTLQDVFGEYQEKNRDFAVPDFNETVSKIAERYRLKKPLRIMLAKGGLDGHDRSINTLLTFFRKLGAEAMFPGLHCSLRSVAKRAVEEDVDIIGISTHIGKPPTYFKKLGEYLKLFGCEDITLIGGGIITSRHLKILPELGVKKFFPGKPSLETIAEFLYEEAKNK